MDNALRFWLNGESTQCLRELDVHREQSPRNLSVLNNLAVAKCNPEEAESLEATLSTLQSAEGESERRQNSSTGPELPTGQTPVARYNQAVIKWRQGKKHEGLDILEELLLEVHSLENGVAAAVCLLSLEGFLQTGMLQKCREPLEFLEALVTTNEILRVSIDWEEPLRPPPDPGPADGVEPFEEDQIPEPVYLKFPCTSKFRLAPPDSDAENGVVDVHPLSQDENLSPLVAFYRAQILSSLGNVRGARMQLQSLLEWLPGCISALCLMAQICFQQRDWQASSRWLDRCLRTLPETSPIRSDLLSNMGALQLHNGRSNLASLCFSISLRQRPEVKMEKQCRTLYNMGIISLQQGRYDTALSQFRTTIAILYLEPCLWIRMAECCLALSEIESSFRPNLTIDRPVLGKRGVPPIALLPAVPDPAPAPQSGALSLAQVDGILTLDEWLQTAYSYLLNALALVKTHGPAAAGAPGVHQLRLALCTKLAFVTLSLNQPERCLYFTEKLKGIPKMDEETALCGVMYQAEALCLLDKPQEAAEILKAFVEGFDPMACKLQPGTAVKDPMDLPKMQKTMYLNLAAVCCANQEFSRAKSSVQKALLLDPTCKKSALLLVYIELAVGNKAGALDILRSQKL